MRFCLGRDICSPKGLKRLSAPEFSKLIVDLYDLLVIAIRDCNLRVTKCFDVEFKKLELIYLAGKKDARINLSNEASKIVVKVSMDEINRNFLDDSTLPADSAFRTCPFCHHNSVDFPNSNDRIK